MARRRSRSRNINLRFGVVAVLILGLVALVVNGVVSSARSSTSFEVLTNQSFGLQANTITSAQSVQGNQLSQLLANAPGMDRGALERQLNALVTTTSSSAQQASIAASPGPSGGVGPKFAAIVAQRAQATQMIRAAVTGLLGLSGPSAAASGAPLLSQTQATQQMSQAGAMLMAADDAFPPLRRTLARAPGHVRLAPSVFISDAGLLTTSTMSALVSALVSSPSLTATHELALASVSLLPSPLPLGNSGQSVTLPPTTDMTVTVVIKNHGNVEVTGVVVKATTTPLQGGVSRTARASTAVPAGGAVSVQLSPITVVPGSTVSLAISMTPAAGQAGGSALNQSFTVIVAPSSVTTTTRKP